MSYRKKESTALSTVVIQPNPWEVRAATKKHLLDEYLKRFKTISTIWAEAVREGWDLSLLNFVRSVADVQAQMIVGERNIGWNGVNIFGAGKHMDEKEIHRFLESQKDQSNTGQIDVSIPTGRIVEWKREFQWLQEFKKKIPQITTGNA